MSETNKITLKELAERKEAKRLSLSDGRYVTRGNPKSGGLSSVYRATDIETSSMVALKVFRSEGSTDEVIEESFRREAQALSDLKHPHIVRIMDSGRDDENGVHFVVMEWVERDLGTVMAPGQYENWEAYYRAVGKGVLDALAFAHTRSTAHRDVKPSNVLVTDDGHVKLCDFGISKIRNFLAPGVTLARFSSAPYSPPELDDGSYSYSRDVFGFAALSVAALTGKAPAKYEELFALLEEAPLEEPIRRVLRRCLELNQPDLRPANAVLLQAELERAAPAPASQSLPLVLLAVTNKVRDAVEHDLGLRGPQAERFIERDLEGARMEELPSTPDKPERSFRVYGGKYGYTALRDNTGGKLLFVAALEYQPSEIDRKRNNAADPEVRFALSGTTVQASSEALDGLLDRLLTFAADQKQRKLEQRELALYQTWVDLLSAKTELEKMRCVRLAYAGREATGEFVRLKLKPDTDGSALVGQDVMVLAGRLGEFRGKAVSRSDGHLIIRPSLRNRIDAGAIPEEGIVETDTAKADGSLGKQKTAVDAVRYGRSVNPELGGYIVSPDRVPVPEPVAVEFINPNIDNDKKEAVIAALSGPALLLVEGPPGTGKTTFITELVLQTLKANPNARVLLTSQTHVALDNSLERIVGQSGMPVNAVRIGQEDDERIAASTRKLMLEAKLPEMRKQALAAGRAFMERWALEHDLNVRDVRRAMALERHAFLKTRLEEVETGMQALEPQLTDANRKKLAADEIDAIEEQFEGLSKERDGLERVLKESMKDLSTYVDSKEELKEFAECSAADLREWAEAYAAQTPAGGQLKQLLQTHAEWETAFGRGKEFQTAVIAASQVVAGTCLGVMSIPGRNDISYDLCIVDEASIATPTEVLVPMARSRRTVVVGDSKQLSPFQDPDLKALGLLEKWGLKPEDQKATLFNHLSAHLPAALKKTLTTQHRMLPAIGDLISECFYGKELRSIERAPAAHLTGVMPRPVTWYSTARKHNRGSRPQGTSFYNDAEVELVMNLLSRVDFYIQGGRNRDKRVSVAVLTGYDPQRQRLLTAVQTRGNQWKSFSEVFVNVVDAFQGREADILVFSVTRSEVRGLGFLKEMERINVALSRGKELLAIIGDHAFCQAAQGAKNPLRDVIDYIRRNPQTCVIEEVAP
jgi:serine/threonine protein kinase